MLSVERNNTSPSDIAEVETENSVMEIPHKRSECVHNSSKSMANTIECSLHHLLSAQHCQVNLRALSISQRDSRCISSAIVAK